MQARRISSNDYFSGVCGTVAVVDGTYAYHHYMQDNFNDDVSMCQSFNIVKLDASQSTGAQVNGCFREGRMKITTFLGLELRGLGRKNILPLNGHIFFSNPNSFYLSISGNLPKADSISLHRFLPMHKINTKI